jgi:Zn-dependent protease
LPDINIGNLILWFIVFLFSLTIHEASHAWTSERFGDSTGRYLGRITLNPIPHIDPVGTILFPLAGQLFSGFIMFGWAKPVPVNPLLWRQKTKANILTSAAGPASNLIFASVALIVAKILLGTGVLVHSVSVQTRADILSAADDGSFMVPVAKILSIAILLNISLGIFNLLPIPPLDGSHILQSLLPYEAAAAYEQLRSFGFILLFGLMFTGVFGAVIRPFVNLALAILDSPWRFG